MNVPHVIRKRYIYAIPSPNRKMPRFVGWVEARNPTNTLGFASLKRQVLQRREPPQRTGSPTYKKMAKVLI